VHQRIITIVRKVVLQSMYIRTILIIKQEKLKKSIGRILKANLELNSKKVELE